MRICAEIQDLLPDFEEETLSTAGSAAVASHLEGCAACRSLLSRYRDALAALRDLAPPVPPELGPRIRAAAGKEGLLHPSPAVDRVRAPRRAGKRLAWALPLAALLLLSIAYGLLHRRGPDFEPAQSSATRPAPSGAVSAHVADAGACAESLFDLWTVDPGYGAAATSGAAPFVVEASGRGVPLPAALLERGPYVADPADATAGGGGQACVPYGAPYGHVLVLSVGLAPAAGQPAASNLAAASFAAEADPRRVSYSRVRWRRDGLDLRLEGRRDPADLRVLAAELDRAIASQRVAAAGGRSAPQL